MHSQQTHYTASSFISVIVEFYLQRGPGLTYLAQLILYNYCAYRSDSTPGRLESSEG